MQSDQAHRRAEALFKKEQQALEGQQAKAEYHASLDAMREKTARLRALRLARDAANKKTPTALRKVQPKSQRSQLSLGSLCSCSPHPKRHAADASLVNPWSGRFVGDRVHRVRLDAADVIFTQPIHIVGPHPRRRL